eukprot:407002_1
MEVDEEDTPTTNPNPIANPTTNKNNTSTSTSNGDVNPCKSAPKRRKKRTRDEMETDDIDSTNSNTNTHNVATKRRKINTVVDTAPQYPPKWIKKMEEYCTIIQSKHQELRNACSNDTHHNSLRESAEVQLKACRESLSNPAFDLNEHIALICKLSYGRSDGLSALVFHIRDIVLQNKTDNALRDTLKEKIREIILKSMARKLYGIKPSKSVNKMEEKTGSKVNAWNQCRVYEWEPLDMAHIPNECRLDQREMKKYSAEMNKYGAFCKKYEWISNNKKGMNLSQDAKDSELQKIDDGIVSWKGKQELMEQQRLMKEAANKKKKELKEQQMKERKEKAAKKKEEMEKLKKEKAAKRKKEKEDKEKLKKEKMEKDKLLKMEKEKLKKEKQKQKLQTMKTPQNQTKRTRKTSTIDRFFTKKARSNTLSPLNEENANKSMYQRLFHAPKATDVLVANSAVHDSIVQMKDNKLSILRADGSVMPRATAIPAAYVDCNNNNNESKMQIDDDDDRLKLQYKFRMFDEDNRPPYFGMRMAAQQAFSVGKLCRNPCSKMVQGIGYCEDDSGVEWYEDIDDLENCDNLDDDEEEAAENALIRKQEKRGLIRSDGFENDRFIVNSDDDEDGEALNDKDMMQNIARSNELRARLKDEYPIKFLRQRGDEYDEPIVVKLPSIGGMKEEHRVLYELTRKKASLVDTFDVEIAHGEKDNDVDYLLAIENKDNKDKDEEERKRKKEKKKKKKKKKEKKEKKEKKKKNKSMKMEMDESDDEVVENKNNEDDDDDIQMANLNIKTPIKPAQKNTLNNYFVNKEKQNKVNVVKPISITNATKNKKRRMVMCELVED